MLMNNLHWFISVLDGEVKWELRRGKGQDQKKSQKVVSFKRMTIAHHNEGEVRDKIPAEVANFSSAQLETHPN